MIDVMARRGDPPRPGKASPHPGIPPLSGDVGADPSPSDSSHSRSSFFSTTLFRRCGEASLVPCFGPPFSPSAGGVVMFSQVFARPWNQPPTGEPSSVSSFNPTGRMGSSSDAEDVLAPCGDDERVPREGVSEGSSPEDLDPFPALRMGVSFEETSSPPPFVSCPAVPSCHASSHAPTNARTNSFADRPRSRYPASPVAISLAHDSTPPDVIADVIPPFLPPDPACFASAAPMMAPSLTPDGGS